jgi:hypothetical protein
VSLGRACLGLCLLALAFAADARAEERLPISGHVLPVLDQARPMAQRVAAAAEPLTLTVVLRREDQAGFRRLLQELYEPTSPRFRRFLTPQEISDRFGPTQQAYDSVKAYFKQHGFVVSQGSANRLTLTLRGTRGQAERALSVRIGDYTLGGRRFYANAGDPALPPHLASRVQAIAGLSDLGTPRHQPQSVEDFWRACGLLLAGTVPLTIYVCWTWWIVGAGFFGLGLVLMVIGACLLGLVLSGNLPRAAAPPYANHPYNPPIVLSLDRDSLSSIRAPHAGGLSRAGRSPRGGAPDGTGQTIGLVQFDTFVTSDVRDFLAIAGAPADQIDRLSQVHVNGGVAVPGAGESEVLLDINVTMGLARGADIVVYDAPLGTSWQAVFNAMLQGGVTVISNSWSSCENEHPLADVQSIDSVLQTAAAAGISVFNASGDTGSTCLNGSPNTAGVPASSPSATAVGGTSLTSGAGWVYGSETWWQGKGGFGVSRHFSRPAYQNGLSGSPMRSVPDVAAVADPINGMAVCQASDGGCPNGRLYGGTSMAAPVWAAYAALLNQSQGQNLGAFNPAIYPLASSGAFHTAASMGSDFAHVGLGSPNLDVLDRLLAGQALGPPDPAVSQVFAATALVDGFEAPLVADIPADGVSAGTISVNLRDANGRTVSGKAVTLAASPGSTAVISPASGVTSESNGAVVFKVTNLTPETVTFTATNATDQMVLSQTAMLTFGVPRAASAGINAFPTTVPPDGVSTATVTVTLRDALDRPTPGKRISISQGSGHSLITGPSPAVTDANGQIEFTVTNTRSEVVVYTAVDETDELPIPGSATVEFSGSSSSCAGDPPAAAEGFTLTPFATGFVAKNFLYSNVNWGGCPGASNPVFGEGGSAYVAEFPSGNLFRLGSTGGTAFSGNLLANHGPTLAEPLFAPDGSMYAARGATGGGLSSGAILQLDPQTGAVIRTVVSGLSCPIVTIDPLSGDLFVADNCFYFRVEDPAIRRVHDPGSATPQVTVYATLPGSPAGAMSFAPDGTLYAVYDYNTQSPGVVKISGTNGPQPPTVTPMTGLETIYWVRVAEAQQDGSAKSLLVHKDSELRLVDITTDPYTVTTLLRGNSSTGVTGPDGCLFVSAGDAIYRLAADSGDCGFVPSSPAPALLLSPSTVAPDPAQGSAQMFTATYRNINVPADTPVFFRISGPNAQLRLGRTDANGVATIRYTGLLAGTDRITASGATSPSAAAPVLVSNTATITWAAPEVAALSLMGVALGLGVLLAVARTRDRSSRLSLRSKSLLVALFLVFGSKVQAQDAMLGAAPTLGTKNLQLAAYPLVFLQSEAFNRFGLGLMAGYGVTERLDVKAEAVYNDDINFYYGANAKYWLVQGGSVDLSVFGGYNRRPHLNGLEAGATVSRQLRDRLELYGGVDLFFGFADSRDFTLVNLDLGAEFELREDIRLFGEASLGLGGETDRFSYVVAGAAYFLQL